MVSRTTKGNKISVLLGKVALASPKTPLPMWCHCETNEIKSVIVEPEDYNIRQELQ